MYLLLLFLVGAAMLVTVGLYKLGRKNDGVTVSASGVSAFAKVAEIEGKLIALKAVAEVKKAEAVVIHAALDEVQEFLG